MTLPLGSLPLANAVPGQILAWNWSSGISAAFFTAVNLVTVTLPADWRSAGARADDRIAAFFGTNRDDRSATSVQGWNMELGFYANADGTGAWISLKTVDTRFPSDGSSLAFPGKLGFWTGTAGQVPTHGRLWVRGNSSHANTQVHDPRIIVSSMPVPVA